MSALADPIGGILNQVVEMERGMTDSEALVFLATGQLPAVDTTDVVENQPLGNGEVVASEGDVRAWLAGIPVEGLGLVASSSLFSQPSSHSIRLSSETTAFKFNPLQPRDPNTGEWVDSPVALVKKAIPAIIYKKHSHNTVVAHSADSTRRLRWDAEEKKFIVEERAGGDWKAKKALTKTAAYEDMKKADRWFEPGDESPSVDKSMKLSSVEPGPNGQIKAWVRSVEPEQTSTKTAPEAPTQTPEPELTVVEPTVKTPPLDVLTTTTPQASPSYVGPAFEMPQNLDQDKLDKLYDFLVQAATDSTKLSVDEKYEINQLQNDLGFMGYSDPLYRRVAQEAGIISSFNKFRVNNPELVGTDDQVRSELARRARETFAGKKIGIRVTSGELDKILGDGRFKTQFETNKSKGNKDQELRSNVEAVWFGLPKDYDPEKRPIYGYVAVDGVRPAGVGSGTMGGVSTDALSQYGQVQVILKDDVRKRTTAMFGDSLTHDYAGMPSPVDNPTWQSFTPVNHKSMVSSTLDNLDRDVEGQTFRSRTYVEAQVHGGVTLADVEEVVLPSNPNAAQRQKLDDAGIKWRVLNLKTAAEGSPEERATALRIAEQDHASLTGQIAHTRKNVATYQAKNDAYSVKMFQDDLKKLEKQLKNIEATLPALRKSAKDNSTTKSSSSPTSTPVETITDKASQKTAQLRSAYAAGFDVEETFTGGNVADSVELLKLSDGTRVIRKKDNASTEGLERNRKEVIAARILNAIGVDDFHATSLSDDDSGHILMTYVPGRTGARVAKDTIDANYDVEEKLGYKMRVRKRNITDEDLFEEVNDQATKLPGAKEIGILDWLLNNRDRHERNWMITPDDRVMAIDHGNAAFNVTTYPDGKSGKMRELVTDSAFAREWLGLKLTKYGEFISLKPKIAKSELASLRSKLITLQSELTRDDEKKWLEFAIKMFDRLYEKAPK